MGRHWKSLDGLRAAAVLAVVAYHLSPLVKGGALGVDVFFVLSGFLITTLLIREQRVRKAVSFRAFYMRRALRLLPAFYAVFAVGALLAATVAATREVSATLTNLPWTFFYVGNLRLSYGHTDLGLLNATWSLAEEEQFYLLWPLICVWIFGKGRGKFRPAVLIALAAIVEMAYRFALVRHGANLARIQYGPDTRSDGLLIGCALGFAMNSERVRHISARLSATTTAAIGGVSGLILAVLALRVQVTSPIGFELAIPVGVLASALLIWSLITAPIGPLHRLLATPPATWIGRRSYGLYLWHVPIILGIPLGGLSHVVRLPIHLGLSFGATALSYRYIEQPFLRRKRQWQTDLSDPAHANARADDATDRDDIAHAPA